MATIFLDHRRNVYRFCSLFVYTHFFTGRLGRQCSASTKIVFCSDFHTATTLYGYTSTFPHKSFTTAWYSYNILPFTFVTTNERFCFARKVPTPRALNLRFIELWRRAPDFNLRDFAQIVRCCFIDIATRVKTIRFPKRTYTVYDVRVTVQPLRVS